jgi:hypothetical protein
MRSGLHPKEEAMVQVRRRVGPVGLLVVVCILVGLVPAGAAGSGGPWWQTDAEPEVPSRHYDSILYSEIAPRLRQIQLNSNRVHVEVIGQSAGGRDLFLVTLSDPEALGRLGRYQAIRRTMLTDPERAQELIEEFGDFKVPVFINGSIHGSEYPGTDAALRLIETLAFEDTPQVQAILDNVILLVNVVQNPDGRVLGTRANAHGFDLNRDFITQSQPETRATVRLLTEWNPMVLLDLHGFVSPMLIEPCTPPHNPNYEYDLYINWAYQQALAMEAELEAQMGLPAQIPFRDDTGGWDDWPPTYTPMYAMFHGAYGHTLETPFEDERGVDAHYWAVWGALNFIAENRDGMIHDQIEIFRRGFLDLPQMDIPPEILKEIEPDQFPDELIQEFPAAYLIPASEPLQLSDHQAARLVEFLLFNDVQVERTVAAVEAAGVIYPPGSYVVWLDQPKRGLANTILEDGRDLSGWEGVQFYSPPSVWSLPLLWGVHRAVLEEDPGIVSVPVEDVPLPHGAVEGQGGAYAYLPTSLAAIRATNDLVARGVGLYRVPGPFVDRDRAFGAGVFVLPAGQPDLQALLAELTGGYGLDILALEDLPPGPVAMRPQRVAVCADAATDFLLDRLGFDFESIGLDVLNRGPDLTQYDVFVNAGVSLNTSGLSQRGKAALDAYAGDYVGIRTDGVRLAQDLELLEVGYQTGPGNSIVRIDFEPSTPVAAGFPADGYAFVNTPLWFSGVGDGVEVAARFDPGPAFLVSGYWPGWGTSGAEGQPVVVYGADGQQDVTLIGLDPTFRGHPEDALRLLANAIYSGLEP